jgi:hypothetical protein
VDAAFTCVTTKGYIVGYDRPSKTNLFLWNASASAFFIESLIYYLKNAIRGSQKASATEAFLRPRDVYLVCPDVG